LPKKPFIAREEEKIVGGEKGSEKCVVIGGAKCRFCPILSEKPLNINVKTAKKRANKRRSERRK
jgi:hypothetical protein